MSVDFRVFETRQFERDLEQIARAGRSDVTRKLHRIVYPQLRQAPHFGSNIRKLRGYSPDTWRYRIGAWRFFFQIDDQERVIYMISASHRSEAYT